MSRKSGEVAKGAWFSPMLLELLVLPTFCVDISGEIVGCNKAFAECVGLDQGDIVGKTSRDLLPDDYTEECYLHDMRLLQNGGEDTCKYVVSGADGRKRMLEVHKNTVSDEDGAIVGLTAQVVDISESMDDRLNLQRTERLYRNTIESLDGMLSVMDSDLRILHSNWKGYEHVPEEVRNKKPYCYTVFKDHDSPCDRCTALKVFADGKKRTFENWDPVTGSHRSITMVPMFGDDGQVENVVEFVRDVTESKKAQQALAQAHERLKSHIGNSPLAVIEWDKGRAISNWSDQAEQMFGWTFDEVIGKSWDDFKFVYPDDQELVGEGVVKMFSGEVPSTTIKNRNYRKDGAVVHCQWFNSALLDQEGRMVSILSQVEDMTELKRYEEALLEARVQAEAANRAKSEFLANMSHEIRTPLNGVIGMLQMLDMTSVNTEQGEYVGYALQASRRLNQLLADILDLSRVEAGKMTIAEVPFHFMSVMDELKRLFQPVVKDKGLELRFEVDQAIPSMVTGDVVRLQQVLSNLVGNAVKFTQRGSITVKATPVHSQKAGKLRVLFSVEDTGIGISADALKKLFKPFSQVEDDFTRNYQGAGLGLSICKRLVPLMGGSISVESEENVGSRFYFDIDFGLDEAQLGAASDATDRPSGVLKVLVAEDDPISRDVLVMLFKKEGHQVLVADDGEEALSQLRESECDIVFMDVQMPKMNGVAATQAIRRGEAGEAVRDIPIIAMTAYAMVGDREKFLAAGMNDYLAKPVEFDELWRVVDAQKKLG